MRMLYQQWLMFGMCRWHVSSASVLLYLSALHVLHNDIVKASLLAVELVDVDDVRVLQCLQNADLCACILS